MRVGLLADVHANLPALDVALARLHEADVDVVLVAGDLVGYGAEPDACVERLVTAGAVCVAGNHDLLVLDRLPPTRFSSTARRAAQVTRGVIAPSTLAHLAALPLVARVGDVVVAHGAPGDPEEYVESRDRAHQLLRSMARDHPGAVTLVLGHTHHPWYVRARDDGHARQLVNPGSVGQSRSYERRPHVRTAVLETTVPAARSAVRFRRDRYDDATSRARVHALGLGDACVHVRPSRRSALARRLPAPTRDRLRQLAGGTSQAQRQTVGGDAP